MSPRHAVLLLAVPALAAGCGGGGGSKSSTSSTTTTSGTTAKGFVAQANQVCIRSDRRTYKIGRLSRDPAGWAKTVAAGNTGLAEMRQVTPPAAKAAEFNLMVSYAQQLVAAIKTIHDNLAKKEYDAAVNAQFRAAALQDKVHAAAKKLGLTFCQQPLTNWPA